MPSANTIELADRATKVSAESGSRALLAAIHRYYLNGGRG